MRHLLTHYRAHLKVSTKPGPVLKAAIKSARNRDFKGPESANTVEKLCFKMSDDFICDLSGITYCSYEAVAEVV